MDTCSLLDIPDLALYKICTYLSCPFDLMHFGNTCSRIRRISSSPSLWHVLSFKWLRGLWFQMEEGSIEETPRKWFLDIISQYSKPSTLTKLECSFPNNEKWTRVDSRKFRFLFNLLIIAYSRDKDDHPAVLYERWLYDIGLYTRSNPKIDYTLFDSHASEDVVKELTNLSQAAERDLRRRKQPFKDRKYYVERQLTTSKELMRNLYPCGANGSICPLLMFPKGGGRSADASGLPGMATCMSFVIARHVQKCLKKNHIPMSKVWELIKIFCTVFISEVMCALPLYTAKLGEVSLRTLVLTLIDEDAFKLEKLKQVLSHFDLKLQCRDILKDLKALLSEHSGIDFAIEDVRKQLRNIMIEEIEAVMFPSHAFNERVTRINLTDSDLIGGDNTQQEMSSAACISDYGAIVTWHLVGRTRLCAGCRRAGR